MYVQIESEFSMKSQYFVDSGRVAAAKTFFRLLIIVSIEAAALGTVPAALAANYDYLVAQGYRWVTVDGPYGCPSKADLRQITNTLFPQGLKAAPVILY